MLCSALLITLWHVLPLLGNNHSAVFIFILRLYIGQPNFIFILVGIDLFQLFTTIATIELLRFSLLHFNCLLTTKEELTIILFIIDFFTDTKNVFFTLFIFSSELLDELELELELPLELLDELLELLELLLEELDFLLDF